MNCIINALHFKSVLIGYIVSILAFVFGLSIVVQGYCVKGQKSSVRDTSSRTSFFREGVYDQVCKRSIKSFFSQDSQFMFHLEQSSHPSYFGIWDREFLLVTMTREFQSRIIWVS